MAEQPVFQKTQRDFCAHIRNPADVPAPINIEDRRMAVYRDLFFNNISSFLEGGFPVLRSLYSDEAWLRLARAFFSNHRCKTPYFAKISEEFLTFLQNDYEPTDSDPPFLLELAHYEWVELALAVVDDTTDISGINRNGNLLLEIPVLSPTAWLLSYQWPVQHISPEFQPLTPPQEPNYIVVYRDRSDAVAFIEANPVTARLFELLENNKNDTGQMLLDSIAEELQHPEPQCVIDGGLQILTRLHNLDIVAGTRAP